MGNSKWWIAALVVSLIINVALAGFVAGRLSHPGGPPVTLDPALGLFRVLHELPSERQEALRPAVREHFRAMRGDIRRMRTAQGNINDALIEQPFEADDLEAALLRFRQALLASQEGSHEALVAIVGAMTPEERLLLRNAMARRDHGERGNRRHGGERHPDQRQPGAGAPH